MPDYIPPKDSELVPWSANFAEQVAANATAWEIPAAEVTDLQTANVAFAALHAKADSPPKNTILRFFRSRTRKKRCTPLLAGKTKRAGKARGVI